MSIGLWSYIAHGATDEWQKESVEDRVSRGEKEECRALSVGGKHSTLDPQPSGLALPSVLDTRHSVLGTSDK